MPQAAPAFHSCPIELIIIPPNRQRQEFDPQKMEELKQSIQDRGLMQAPVVRIVGEELHLVAGERRLRAIKELWFLGGTLRHNDVELKEGIVPFVTMGELDPLEAEEAELDENLKREDLTWQEHASAVERLHRLRQEQKSIAASVMTPDLYPVQTVADTALEVRGSSLGSAHEATRRELIVAKHLTDPDVQKAKSADEAFKLLKKKEELKKNAELAQTVGETFSSKSHTLLNTDCIEWIAQQPAGQFDVLLCDPPYGMNADQFGNAAGKLSGIQHHYNDSPEHWTALMKSFSEYSFTISAPQAHAYIFCDLDRFHTLKEFMQNAGWYVFRTPLIVYKLNSGRVPLPDRGPRRQWEMVLYAIKGDKPVTQIYPDVIPCSGDEQLLHGAQKPVELYTNLLMRSVRPGDKVLDAFAGTGTIFEAAHRLKVYATGIEIDQGSYGTALKRLQGLDTP